MARLVFQTRLSGFLGLMDRDIRRQAQVTPATGVDQRLVVMVAGQLSRRDHRVDQR